MLFTTPVFIFIFLPLVFLLNLIFPVKLRNLLILGSSLIFYWYGETWLVFLLLGAVLFNFIFARCLHQLCPGRIFLKNLVLFCAIILNLSLLAYFKYANFFVLDILTLDASLWKNVALPLGISFYIFQGLSYVIDVYAKRYAPSSNIIDFATYITCFPQLVAGPIVRYGEIKETLEYRVINFDDICVGCRRFTIGLGKKMLIANPMAYAADRIYAMPFDSLDFSHAWLAILCYSLQIYYDFSGYSDMAIGLGRLIGFKFPENFNYPYAAASISSFWRRWHMTLTRWFKDYVYIPLGGNRVSSIRTTINKWTVFALCGLWHGASWNFLLWGCYHGFFISLEGLHSKRLKIISPVYLRHVYTFFIVALGWVLFRAEDLPSALAVYKAAFGLNNPVEQDYSISLFMANPYIVLPLVCGLLASFPVLPWLRAYAAKVMPESFVMLIRYSFYLCVFLVSCAFTFSSLLNPFLYFRF